MAVKVNIRAEVNQAIGGLKDLKAALYEVGAAGKGLDDVGKQFSGDWYEKLGKVSDEFDRIRDNFEAMRRTMADMRRVTEMAAKHGYKKNDPLSYVDKISTFYANSKKGEELQARFALNLANGPGAGSVLDGVNMAAQQRPQWEKPAFKQLPKRQWDRPAFNVVPNSLPTHGGGDGGGSSGGGSGGGSGGSGGNSYAWGKNLKWAGGMMLGLAGINSIRQVISGGVRSNESEGISTESIFRRSTLGTPFESLVFGMRDLSRVIQLSSDETAKLADEYVRTSGTTEGLGEKLYTAVGFGRGFGMDPGISSRLMGQASLVGYSDKSTQREFAALLAHTIASSHMFARSEQIMEDMVNHMGNVATREGRTASLTEMTSYGALMGKLYGTPAMAGGGGQSFLQGLQGLGTGGDLTKEMFAWKSLGQAAGYDFIKMEKLKDASPFASIKDVLGSGSDKTKLELMWPEVMRQSAWLPGNAPIEDKAAYFLKTQTGMNMNLGSAGVRLLNGQMGDFGMFKGWLESTTGQSLTNLKNPEAFGELAKLYENQDMGSWRKIAGLYTQGDKASKADRDKLQQLLDAKDDDGLRAILPQIVANTGAPTNPAEEARDAEAKLTTAITELTTPVKELGVTLKKVADFMIPDGNGPFAKTLNSAADSFWGEGKTPSDWFKETFPDLSQWLATDPVKRGVMGAIDAVIPSAGATMGAGDYPGQGLGMPAGGSVSPNAKKAYDFFISKGLKPHQAAGLVGNFMQESYPELRTGYMQGGKTLGIANWTHTGGRMDRLLAMKNPESLDTQLDYAWKELNSTHKSALDALMAADNVSDAAVAVRRLYEMPGKNERADDKRIGYAKQVLGLPSAEYSSTLKSGAKIPVDGITDVSGLAGSFGYKGYGKLAQRKAFIMHHTGGRGTVEGVQRTFGERDFPAHFVIDREGKIFRTLPEGQQGRHIRSNRKLGLSNVNTEGVEIIAKDDKDVLPEQIQAANRLRKLLGYSASQVYGHGEINSHKQETEGRAAAEAVRMADAAPKTPADQDKVVRELTTPNQANARVDGHHTLDIVMRNAEGKPFYTRRGLALSEPQVFGSPGERKSWNDTATMPAS